MIFIREVPKHLPDVTFGGVTAGRSGLALARDVDYRQIRMGARRVIEGCPHSCEGTGGREWTRARVHETPERGPAGSGRGHSVTCATCAHPLQEEGLAIGVKR
ncbi:hypothetical protein GCM10014713_26260 [Streptomyces purpureus]|uniref:Uncharacterized protein n=1 Tax=Streptomyces purpureus TaxID=1951 RepID=A0A918H2G3_9ACTN|nr:hypothetical protein GCM10014713_26260 [Streptomyces purpureus]